MTIKELRQLAGMTQKGFSKILGIPKRSIENWEAGSRQPPEYLVKLIEYKLRNEQLIPLERGGGAITNIHMTVREYIMQTIRECEEKRVQYAVPQSIQCTRDFIKEINPASGNTYNHDLMHIESDYSNHYRWLLELPEVILNAEIIVGI